MKAMNMPDKARNSVALKYKLEKHKKPLLSYLQLFTLFFLGLFAYGCDKKPPTLSEPPTSAQIQQGKDLFIQNCASCHGAGAVGQDTKRPKGGTDSKGVYIAPALNGKGHAWHHSNDMLFNTVKNGSIAEESPMRAHKDRLSDDEIISIIHYFKSLWPQEIQIRHAQRPKTP